MKRKRLLKTEYNGHHLTFVVYLKVIPSELGFKYSNNTVDIP